MKIMKHRSLIAVFAHWAVAQANFYPWGSNVFQATIVRT